MKYSYIKFYKHDRMAPHELHEIVTAISKVIVPKFSNG